MECKIYLASYQREALASYLAMRTRTMGNKLKEKLVKLS